jgi:hypothetical protein
MNTKRRSLHIESWGVLIFLSLTLLVGLPGPAEGQTCARFISANVVALDQVYFWNRMGAVQPHGMVFALKRDVVPISGTSPGPGNAQLRSDKRPRPLVLRMNVGDCLNITFYNWLSPSPVDEEQVATRDASIHVNGMQLVTHINDDGTWVGANPKATVAPGGIKFYRLFAEREGSHILTNGAAFVGGEGDNGTLSAGLFGSVNVEHPGSVWYRSQVTRQELDWASFKTSSGAILRTPGGHPIINYNAVYPPGHKFAGKPILKILDSTRIFHSDLTAIIAGPGPDGIIPNDYPEVGVYPDRNKPFREFTIIFHDEIAAVQAFPQFNLPELNHTLASVRDAFAINYGTGGIGSEILANRLGVGPMHDCTDCLYEEFFLTSWAVADPAMVVDVPANYPCTPSDIRLQKKLAQQGITTPTCIPQKGPKATKAFYPEDPSNVYHSYLNDHLKFRNLLAGSDDHHIFHLHAHQWLHTPDGDNSTYLDSQAIGQGTSFTYEITNEGSGNRNKTVGDSIFHCHFYPHFAMGMWSLWRVHDVFEEGTKLDNTGRPVHTLDSDGDVFVQTRALPDAEIEVGTPIPALVPLPGQPMPPMPQVQVGLKGGQVWIDPTGSGNPGYPFFVAGVAGHRPPQPPLDFALDSSGNAIDGGLPRHVIVGGTFWEEHTRFSFEKMLETADAIELNEAGERWEQEAMKFHADQMDGTQDGLIRTYTPMGTPALFEVNGSDPKPGAPYAEPCFGGRRTPPPRRFLTYKAADIQLDAVLNKEGWHFPQQRMISLWEDVDDFLHRGKPPEPFFFRANTYDCVTFWSTNLVPRSYELDDFQVRTPTDILGQHIHLVKFDVTSSDGSANGFNYEDGTLSPEEVRERIVAINALGGIQQAGGGRKILTPKPHPFPPFSTEPDWLGAQTTVQLWYVDDVLNTNGDDRTLRTVFTHDHFGPSTHQQAGLYAGLVVEPFGSTWLDNETGSPLGFRHDGGPTSWQAVIEGVQEDEVFREFLFEFADFQLAYLPNDKQPAPFNKKTGRLPGEGFDDPPNAINPPGRADEWTQLLTGKPWVYEKPALTGKCPTLDKTGTLPVPLPPCPEAISAQDPGTMVSNYRDEPVASRIYNPSTGGQASGTAGDLSFVFSSKVTRANPLLNVQPTTYLPLTSDIQPKDPYTPLLRAYENDRVHVRLLVGAHEEEHNVAIHGVRWLFEPSEPNSGFRASQMMGISEHYEFEIPSLPKNSVLTRGSVDFLWETGAAVDDRWTGTWGLIRSYQAIRPDLHSLSNNPPGSSPPFGDPGKFNGICPKTAPVRSYDIAAVAAREALPGGTLVYNSRTTGLINCVTTPSGGISCSPSGKSGKLHDPTAMFYAYTSDLVASGVIGGRTIYKLRAGAPIEPIVIRAAAGECVKVKLHNYLPPTPFDLPGYSLMPPIIDRFNVNQVTPSVNVGINPQLVSYDVTRSDGFNVGFNPTQTVPPGGSKTYTWYAGQIVYDRALNTFKGVDTEFGSANLQPSDPIKHSNKGLVGALIVEPKGAGWSTDPGTRAKATVFGPTGVFREFAVVNQTDINLRYADGSPVRTTASKEDAGESGNTALNFRTEPGWFRKGLLPQTVPEVTRKFPLGDTFSNAITGGADPQTPIFDARVGTPVRFRFLFPGGHAQIGAMGIHGHIWQEQPYALGSTVLTTNNPISEWKGVQHGSGPTNHFDALLQHGAGGAFGITGDYMFRDHAPWRLWDGLWGIFRVTP